MALKEFSLSSSSSIPAFTPGHNDRDREGSRVAAKNLCQKISSLSRDWQSGQELWCSAASCGIESGGFGFSRSSQSLNS
jgi:hypothetical protein